MNNNWSISILFWVLALVLADKLNAQETKNYVVKKQIVAGLPKCPAGYNNTCYQTVVEHQVSWESISQEEKIVTDVPRPTRTQTQSIKDKLNRRFRWQK